VKKEVKNTKYKIKDISCCMLYGKQA